MVSRFNLDDKNFNLLSALYKFNFRNWKGQMNFESCGHITFRVRNSMSKTRKILCQMNIKFVIRITANLIW